mgnify:CR=1 FL=1
MDDEPTLLTASQMAKKLKISKNYLYIKSREAIENEDSKSIYYPTMKGGGSGGSYKFSAKRVNMILDGGDLV